jgi:hypothetical protein
MQRDREAVSLSCAEKVVARQSPSPHSSNNDLRRDRAKLNPYREGNLIVPTFSQILTKPTRNFRDEVGLREKARLKNGMPHKLEKLKHS